MIFLVTVVTLQYLHFSLIFFSDVTAYIVPDRSLNLHFMATVYAILISTERKVKTRVEVKGKGRLCCVRTGKSLKNMTLTAKRCLSACLCLSCRTVKPTVSRRNVRSSPRTVLWW